MIVQRVQYFYDVDDMTINRWIDKNSFLPGFKVINITSCFDTVTGKVRILLLYEVEKKALINIDVFYRY